MIGEKFFTLVSSLSDSELNSCIRFSKSNLHNKREEIVSLLVLFKKNKSRFFEHLQDENKLFLLLFPKEKNFQTKYLSDLFHYSVLIIEEFIAIQSIQNNKITKLKLVQQYLNEKNLENEALSYSFRLLKHAENALNNKSKALELFLLKETIFQNSLKNFNVADFDYAKQALAHLDTFYYTNRLHYSQELLANQIHLRVQYDFTIPEKLKNTVFNTGEIVENVIVQLYNFSYDLYNGKGTLEAFYTFKTLLLAHIDSFDFNTQKFFLTDLSNYMAILYSQSNDAALLKEIFDVYKLQVKYKILYLNGFFQSSNFNQILRVAIFQKEFAWAELFIEEHKGLLEDPIQVLVAQANLLFEQGFYDKTEKLCLGLMQENLRNNIEIKIIYAKTLFELKAFDTLDTHLQNMEMYIRRQNDLSDVLKEKNLQFVLFLKRLLKNKNKATLLKVLKNEVMQNTTFFHRKWLIEKL